MATHRERREKLASYIGEKAIFALILEDFENLRSRSLRYLSGHPTDAILFIFKSGKTVLVPWDVSMAHERADVDEIVPYTGFRRSFREAASTILRDNGLEAAGADRKIEVSAKTPYPRYRDLCSELEGTAVLCEERGVDTVLSRMRAVKDAAEAASLRRAAAITNKIVDSVEALLEGGETGLTEIELAQFVQREALRLGAEGLGFETLAAGPGRSWGIHPFPVCSGGGFGGPGLSILDFGVSVDGYTSDVTITLARGRLSEEQERMISLVQRAYDAAVSASHQGASPQEPARGAEEVLAAEGWKMPHALGHGIGLDAHEGPLLRSQGEPSDPELLPGMAFTIEPGLYHPEHGGVRLENDLLITERGTEVLTNARIIRLA